MLSFIWAEDNKHGIGKNNNIPWKSKEDLKHFANITKNHIVVMGLNTFKSLNMKNGLKDRVNIVVTHNPKKYNEKNDKITFIDENRLNKLIMLWNKTHIEVFIIGGREIFNLIFNKIHPKYLYRTLIDGDYNCTKNMIDLDYDNEYFIVDQHDFNDGKFIKYERSIN